MSTPPLNNLVTKIRTTHPGAYDDMDDATLTKKVLAKYPQYSDLAAPAMPKPPNPIGTAPEESGVETGPILSPHPEQNAFGHAEGRTLAREVNSGVDTLKGMIPAAYHGITTAFDPATTPEEQAIAQHGGGLSLAIHRIVTKPVVDAVSDYAAGRVSPDDALSVAPEAMGTAAGTVVGGKLLESAIKSPNTPKIAKTGAEIGKGAAKVVDEATFNRLGKAGQAVGNAAKNIKEIWKPASKPTFPTTAAGPEAPDPQLLQARSLQKGAEPYQDPAAGLGKVPVAKPTPPPVPARVPMWQKIQQVARTASVEPTDADLEKYTDDFDEPAQSPAPQSTEPAQNARVKMFVSNRDVQSLKDLGWDDSAINKMKPDEAQAKIDGKISPPTEEINGTPGPTAVPKVNDPAMADVEAAQRGRINELDAKYPVKPGSAVTQPDPFAQPKPAKPPIKNTYSTPEHLDDVAVEDQIRNYAGPEDPSEDAVGAIHRRLFSEGSSARSPKGDAIAEATGEDNSGPVKYTANKPAGLETAPMAEKVSVLQKLKQMAARNEISPEGQDLMGKLQKMLDVAKQHNEGRF